ncbi:hypothetical protein BX600DRAFT_233248 [Xylariales sp. PMI_506]|nr:hypothetical protein BX600DRAFT_233248 [Xylariales sp. PMI_506]
MRYTADTALLGYIPAHPCRKGKQFMHLRHMSLLSAGPTASRPPLWFFSAIQNGCSLLPHSLTRVATAFINGARSFVTHLHSASLDAMSNLRQKGVVLLFYHVC